jgi:hypothetical protein
MSKYLAMCHSCNIWTSITKRCDHCLQCCQCCTCAEPRYLTEFEAFFAVEFPDEEGDAQGMMNRYLKNEGGEEV